MKYAAENTDQSILSFQIGDRTISHDSPTFIIAEIGINHNGDLQTAEKLIQAAAEAKVDAVKFQKRHLPSLYKSDVLEATEKYEQNFQYMIPILKAVELRDEDFVRLKSLCISEGLEFLCTPFDRLSVDFLTELGVNAFKIASADLSNFELLEYVADLSRPMIVSTGMSYWGEIEQAVQIIRKRETPFALLHCRSAYPVWPREVNLRMINRLRSFECPVGYSGHDIGITIPLVAASMGACIIEKHITLDRSMRGPDHKISLEPYELKRMVRDIRVADQAMAKQHRFLLRGEILNRELFGKSLVARVPIQAGTQVTKDMIQVQGPGKGISPSRINDLIGKWIRRHMATGDFFLEEDINGGAQLDFHLSFRSTWGLICRFNDMEAMLGYHPRVIEFHLTEKDLEQEFLPRSSNGQQLVVHAPEYIGDQLLDLCSVSQSIRSRSVDLIQRSIGFTKRISGAFQGTPKVIVHPGAMSLNVKLDKERLRANLVRSLGELDAGGMELLLENLPPYPWYFGGQWKGSYFIDDAEIVDFCRETGYRICFDLSHAALHCNAKDKNLEEFVLNLKPLIRHLHLADAYGLDGEGVQIGEGDIAFDHIMPAFSDYEGTWVPEIWRGHLNGGKGFLLALNRLSKYDI